MNTRFIELAGEINSGMPFWVVGKVMDALNEKGKSLKGSKILILGMAYKKDIDDPRESPSFKLMEILIDKGVEVNYNDPFIPELPRMRKYNMTGKSIDLTKENLAKYDCVLISTDHSVYDFDFIVEHAQLVIDTRNSTLNVKDTDNKIVKA
jgi:UDP-N-acetyl-D-glucosamine dehydrogenase